MKEDKLEVDYKQGQTWWFVNSTKIKKCEYLCVFPANNPNYLGIYDIIIWKDLDVPERIYRENLRDLVKTNNHITSYEEACVELLKQAEERLTSLKRIYGKDNK